MNPANLHQALTQLNTASEPLPTADYLLEMHGEETATYSALLILHAHRGQLTSLGIPEDDIVDAREAIYDLAAILEKGHPNILKLIP